MTIELILEAVNQAVLRMCKGGKVHVVNEKTEEHCKKSCQLMVLEACRKVYQWVIKFK